MDSRSFSYLSGRFRDYYRSQTIELPPDADEREWGYIPFNEDDEVFMVRHKSLGEIGDIDGFAKRESPRHFYFSSSKYTDPGVPNMNNKGWKSADLIFDIDADHLSNVDEETTPYDEMLAEGKVMVQKLITVLQNDFDFDHLEAVFSGGRGYHIHVRDESIQQLGRAARNEIVDYITGTNIEFETITTSQPFQLPPTPGQFPKSIGWGKKYFEFLQTNFSDLREDVLDIYEVNKIDSAASEVSTLLKDKYSIDSIGVERSKMVITALNDRDTYNEVIAGNVEATPEIKIIAKQLLEQAIAENKVEIDEPVTTDTNRLIRLPKSLHGGSGLKVTPLNLTDIEKFNPLNDAIPEIYMGSTVQIEVLRDGVVSYVGGEKTTYSNEVYEVPEYEAIHLLCQDDAKKVPE